MFAAQVDFPAMKSVGGPDHDVAAIHVHIRPQLAQSLQMKVHRPVSNDASAGQRDTCFAQAAQQGSHHANGGAHFAHEVIRGIAADILGLDENRAAVPFHLGAQILEDLQHVIRIAQIRHARDPAFLRRQQRGRQNGQGGIFRTTDIDGTSQLAAALNDEFFHQKI